jgi:hypothetical protein
MLPEYPKRPLGCVVAVWGRRESEETAGKHIGAAFKRLVNAGKWDARNFTNQGFSAVLDGLASLSLS